MIGVIPKEGQISVVEEFFELFKTPWELYRAGNSYEVVIATADEIPEVNARLVLVYGAGKKDIDERLGMVNGERLRSGVVGYRGGALPIYGELFSFVGDKEQICCVKSGDEAAGLRVDDSNATVIRLGYDLFEEVRYLLTAGQPAQNAHIPTLEMHIEMLREWIAGEGIPFVEIPATAVGSNFTVCLTHDIDFVGIRRHVFDHTMWGFLYRATFGGLSNFLRGRRTLAQLARSWLSAISLPLVYLGWARDFWEPFGWYLRVEEGLAATYFVIPFKRRAGEKVPGRHAARRASSYDVSDIPESTAELQKCGCEIGTHGIDAWHDSEKGRAELAATRAIAGCGSAGIRMHWLLHDENTPVALEQAGYEYDSTCGYNEAVGYRAGTSQVFRPAGARTLLELPMHIQDGALFYPERLDLAEPEADRVCDTLIENSKTFGGVLTVLWHDRSHGPERFWGEFYVRLVAKLKSLDTWFGTCGQVVGWFRKRREVRFEQIGGTDGTGVRLRYDGEKIEPKLRIRVYGARPPSSGCESPGMATREFREIAWDGKSVEEVQLQVAPSFSGAVSNSTKCIPL